MKIICTKKNLSLGLGICARIIGGGGGLPVLNNILLKTDGGRLKASATNLEIALNTWVGGKVEEEGEITVPARLISDYVNNLVSEKITLSTKGQTLELEGEKAQTHIKGLPAEDFPLIPKVGEGGYAKIEGEKLKQGIKEVEFAAAFSETQPEISGVFFRFDEGKLTLAATDRYRLAEVEIELSSPVGEAREIIVPQRAVSEMVRLAPDGMAEIFLSEGQICLKTDSTELVSRLIEGQYPDYKQIIPKGFSTEGEVDREEFLQALKGASLFATENNNVEIEINPATKRMIVKSQSAQVGDSEILIDGVVTGEKKSVIFNYRYLLDCLNNLNDEKIKLMVMSASAPVALAPVGRENYLYIVMPIKT